MKTFLLEARQLTCIRDNRTLFSGLNFQLHGGHILLIEGVNGAGKTSLLRILTGLRQPDEGELFWNTESIENLAASFYQDVAYIGHNNGLKETLTAKENLKYAKALAVRALSIDESLQCGAHQFLKDVFEQIG